MWILIIIAIIVFVIYKFNADRNEMRQKIESRGGLRNVYPKLFHFFLSDADSKITSEKPDEVIITWKSEYSVAQFRFLQLFNRLRIEYVAQTSLLGKIQNHWEFPSSTSQELMIKTITNDIELKMNSEYDWDGLQGKIDDIINQ
jgi:hypothetical protein